MSVNADLESARRDWEEGYRRFRQESHDPLRADRLHLELEAVTDELRKRIGSTFTLDELSTEYRQADAWARAVVAERASAPGWATLSIVEGAAFFIYSRGAIDYEP